MWAKDHSIRIQQEFIRRIYWYTEGCTMQAPRIRISKNPFTCSSSKIVSNDVGFTWSVFMYSSVIALGATRLRRRWNWSISTMRSLRLKRLRKSKCCNSCLMSPLYPAQRERGNVKIYKSLYVRILEFLKPQNNKRQNTTDTQSKSTSKSLISESVKNNECTFLDASRATEHASRYTLVVYERLSWKHI